MAEPSNTPRRAARASDWRGHQGIMYDGPSPPAAACDSPTEPWYSHSHPREITPDACRKSLCPLELLIRLLVGSRGQSVALSGATRRVALGFMRVLSWIQPRYFTILLGTLSSASCLYALTAMQLAHKRVCASPCPPTHILPFADRSIYEIGDLLTGQRLPSEPPCALSASRASHLHVVGRVHVHARQRLSRACCARCAWSHA